VIALELAFGTPERVGALVLLEPPRRLATDLPIDGSVEARWGRYAGPPVDRALTSRSRR
jgi:hypothetical protein